MKTKTIILAAALTGLLFSASTFNSNAQAIPTSEKTVSAENKLSVLEVKPMQFRVLYNTPQSDAVLVRILDINKTVLFSETKRTESNYIKYFDLSTLLDGSYTFEITDGKEKHTQTFDILTKTSRVVSSIN
jgi:hypothetical protein